MGASNGKGVMTGAISHWTSLMTLGPASSLCGYQVWQLQDTGSSPNFTRIKSVVFSIELQHISRHPSKDVATY